MQWEQLTSADFRKAAKKTDVCVVAMGVMEKHGDHLPLGTDFLNGHKMACLAADKEPAVVFPPFYFGQIYEARCFPGCLTIKPTLLIELVQGVCDEIGRNGFRKILLYNFHGGNFHFLQFLAQCSLWEEKPYQVYTPTRFITTDRQKKWDSLLDMKIHGHACECETSYSLLNHTELVKMGRVPGSGWQPRRRLKHMNELYSGLSWYGDYPEHYAGDARPATAAKGKALRQLLVDSLADWIAIVKKDKITPALRREFFRRERRLRGRV